MRYPNVGIFSGLGNIMKGVPPQFEFATQHQVRINLRHKTATETQIDDIGSDLHQIDSAETGSSHTAVVSLQKRVDVLFDPVAITSHKTGKFKYFSYKDQMAEEHLFIKNTRGSDCIIDITLNYVKQHSSVNIFNADHLSDGPIAIARLLYVLPLEFHGKFIYE